jgi:hypothetical protein
VGGTTFGKKTLLFSTDNQSAQDTQNYLSFYSGCSEIGILHFCQGYQVAYLSAIFADFGLTEKLLAE